MPSITLAYLESQSSLLNIFQDFWHRPTEPIQLGDVEGSDFKKLVHKHKHIQDSQLEKKIQKHHISSPDFRPVVYLERKPISSPRLGHSLYNYLFQHEDRYFNHDRDELSKDIFPVGYQPA